MFLCDDCHNPANHVGLFRSRGPCEGCGKVAACIDCHLRNCMPPQPTNEPKEKTAA